MSFLIANRFAPQPVEPRKGGTATVYKAIDIHTQQAVALKLYDGPDIDDEFRQELYSRERDSLMLLEHPNIVRLIDSGFDDARRQHYIVLEWVEEDLPPYLERAGVHGWDEFAPGILLPLMSGLALGHKRGVVHRDIKPANIMVSELGEPKLTDFGIAKLLASTRLGVTLREFRTLPYAPRKGPDQPITPQDDLFSLGVTALECLIRDPQFSITHANLPRAIREAHLPGAAAEFIARLVSMDPNACPLNAEVALVELRGILQGHHFAEEKQIRLYVQVAPGILNQLYALFQRSTKDAACQEVLRDLAADAAIDYRDTPSDRVGASNAGAEYRLLGQRLEYRAVVRPNGPNAGALLDIVGVTQLPPSLLENKRDRSLALHAEFVHAPPYSATEGRNSLEELGTRVAEHAQRRDLMESEREEREMFRRWRSILKAKRCIEDLRAKPIAYNYFRPERPESPRTIVFTLDDPLEEDIRDQDRKVSSRRGTVSGTVVSVTGKELTFVVEEGDPRHMEERGTIELDVDLSKAAIRRQEQALDDVRSMRGARPDLAKLLSRPDQAQVPVPTEITDLFQPMLDEAKQAALRIALGSSDFTLVQGPPGTGKTTWIAELICQFLLRNPGKKVLLVAQTHAAVDHALKKIIELRPELRIVRAGHTGKVDQSVGQYRVELQMEAWSRQVGERSGRFLRDWAERHGIHPEWLPVADKLALLLELEGRLTTTDGTPDPQAQLPGTARSEGPSEPPAGDDDADGGFPDEAAPTANLPSVRVDSDPAALGGTRAARARCEALRAEIADTLHDGSLRTASVLLLIQAVLGHAGVAQEVARQLSKLLGIQRDWLRQFGTGEGFEKALVSVSDVVAGTCVGIAAAGRIEDAEFGLVVIDEASKATPTEALVAMARGKRWVLVGDQKQLPPFAEEELRDSALLERFDIAPEELEQTLFDRLMQALPAECKPRLTVQHRMLPAIGDLISACFYEGELESRREGSGKEALRRVLPRPVTWYSTSRLQRRRERERRNRTAGGFGYDNPEEATRIVHWLRRLEQTARRTGERLTVGVISGYLFQKEHLVRAISPDDPTTWRAISIEINSVDAFQGREVDAVVYSVTRSNAEHKVGHLASEKRLNVALSRGRDALVIFGDTDHCARAKAAENPFLPVLHYMEDHPDTCAIEVLNA